MAGFGNSHAVQPHVAAFDQGISIRAVLYEASIDQPFVEALRQLNCLSSALSEQQAWRKANSDRLAFQVAVDAALEPQASRGAQT